LNRVEVDEQDSDLRPAAARPEKLVEAGQQPGPVRQPGQRVVSREVGHHALGLAPAVTSLWKPEVVRRRAGVVADSADA